MTKIYRVDMGNQSVAEEEVPSKWELLGGRGFTSRVIMDEITPGCHPLGPNNKLIMAPGVVTGSTAATSGRVSVGAKSPLTGGTKESNAGTPVSQMLGRLRIKGIIFENQPENGVSNSTSPWPPGQSMDGSSGSARSSSAAAATGELRGEELVGDWLRIQRRR